MDLRREPRIAAEQTVVITVLGEHETHQNGRIRNASGRGLAIEAEAAIPTGTALKIDLDDAILLGEAVYCKAVDGSYLLGVELDQVLCGLTELGRRLEEFARDEPPGFDMPRHRISDRRQPRPAQ